MERLANYILRLYPIDHVPFKRRVTLHTFFWGIYYILLLVGLGIPSDSVNSRFIGATSTTLTSSVFFYVFSYFTPYLCSKYIGWLRVVIISLTIVAFYLFMASETYIRAVLVIENYWVTTKNSRTFDIYYDMYKSGFWAYFQINNVSTDTIQLIFTSLPAFFLNLSEYLQRFFLKKNN